MALNYGDNYVLKIKKGSVEYFVRDSIAEAAINTIQGDAETEGSIAKAAADAQSAAESTAATALSSKVGNIGEGTVKAYVDDAITTLSGTVEEHSEVTAAALTDLDSRVTSLDSGAVKSVTEGATNGTVAVDGTDVAVHGLGSAAYVNTTAFDAAGAATTAKTELIGASTDATSADTINAAKNYAKGLVDAILGEDSASTTLATLKAVIQELNAPENQDGITGTFIDTVKADLTGLTKTVGNEQVHATVTEYVDNAVSSGAASAIANLNATPSQTATAANGQLSLSLTQIDGVVTGISGSIAANTYDAYNAAATVQTTVIGASGDASSANTIYGAKAYADAAIANQTQSTVENGVLILGL